MAAEVQAMAAEVVAGAHMQDWGELRQRRGGAPAGDGEAAPAGPPEGKRCLQTAFIIIGKLCRACAGTDRYHMSYFSP